MTPGRHIGSGSTLIDVLETRARLGADDPAFTMLDGDDVLASLTYRALEERVRAVAAQLQDRFTPGDRVLICCPAGIDYIVAFFACVCAGVTAVPLTSPLPGRTAPRLKAVVADSEAAGALSTPEGIARVQRDDPDLAARIDWFVLDAASDPARWRRPDIKADDIAFLQYTSGSTSDPKGVMVTHASAIANAQLGADIFGIARNDVFVSWLPPYHDMGLIGTIVWPLLSGAHSVQMEAIAYARRPFRWLKAIADYRGTITWAPDFAFAQIADRIRPEELATLDLSTLRVALNASERVRPATMRLFADVFASAGLDPLALMPAYGLAEATLMTNADVRSRAAGGSVTSLLVDAEALKRGDARPANNAENGIELASVGPLEWFGHRAAIVEPDRDVACADWRVGEIALNGPSIAAGYWRKAEATAATYVDLPAIFEGRWLRTGDLGFGADGQLYVIGRRKEMMIFGGRNIYPQDVELDIEALDPAFREHGCAAFSIGEDLSSAAERPSLVIIQELHRNRALDGERWARLILGEVGERHGIFDVAAIYFVKAGGLPRTSSGKIQRTLCAALVQQPNFDPLASWYRPNNDGEAGSGPEASATEQALMAEWSDLLSQTDVTPNSNLVAMGGGSLFVAQLRGVIERRWRLDLPLRALFGVPVLRDMARLIDVARMIGQRDLPAERERPQLPVAASPDAAPLSPAQRGLWLLDRLEPAASSAYNLAVGIRLVGPLDWTALQQSLNVLVARHEVLRTRFALTDGAPVQLVEPTSPFLLATNDLGDRPEAEREAALVSLAASDAAAPFDLVAAPPLRGRIVRLTESDHALLLVQHHIISDGQSLETLIDELGALYAAFANGDTNPLPAPLLQYRTHAVRHNAWLADGRAERQAAWWQEQLAGAPALLDLPTDRPRPPVRSYAGGEVAVVINDALGAALRALCERQGVTLFMTLVAAWSVLMTRLGGCDEVVVGTAVANRPQPDLRGLIGYFVNTLPLRVPIPSDGSIADLIGAVRDIVMDALDHSDLPFAEMVERIRPDRSPNHGPIFQTMVSVDPAPASSARFKGLAVSPLEMPTGAVQFDLSLTFSETAGRLSAKIEYASDLFDRATVERWADHFLTLLCATVETPTDRRLDSLPLLAPAEYQRQIYDWNEATAPFPAEHAFHVLVADQARQRPEAPALVFRGSALSYGALDAAANRLADRLAAQGVGKEDRVAICVQRGFDMVVALLGILKAGAAYLPLDPTYPGPRLRHMISDGAPRIIVTHRAARGALPDTDTPIIDLDTDAVAPSASPASRASADVATDPDQLAYLIYTSGTTAQSKGVEVQHRSVAAMRAAWVDRFALRPGMTHLQMASLSFDVCTGDCVRALTTGGTLVIAEREDMIDPARLYALMRNQGVVFAEFVPTTLVALVAHIERVGGDLGFMHTVISGRMSLTQRSRIGSLRSVAPAFASTILMASLRRRSIVPSTTFARP